MEPLLLLTMFISFFCTFLAIPFWLRKSKQIGFLWQDMNKPKHPKNVAGSGGIVVFSGATIGILLYVAFIVFIFGGKNGMLTQIFALLSVMTIAAFVGLVDDFFGWRHGGLSIRSRIILVLFSAIPLMALNAGNSSVNLPFLGLVNLGIFYPLLVIPIGIVGATTTYNFLAGFNGLEASQGIIILAALSIVTFMTGNAWLSVIALCMVFSLLAFYIFNKYPAKIFPGDVMTYTVGALIVGIAILGNIEKVAILFFTPYIIEFFLKLRGKLKKHSFGLVQKDGSLEVPYGKIYGLEHLAIKILKKIKPSKKAYEKEVVYLINAFQIVVILLTFLFVF